MPAPNWIVENLKSALGAVIGAILGYYLFRLIYQQGFYGMMIPGALLGLGCGWLSNRASRARGVACGAAALVLSLFIEWKFRPFVVDGSLGYFLRHLGDLTGVSMLMIAAGSAFAYWFGREGAGGRFGPIGPRSE